MKAIRLLKYGGPLAFHDVPAPTIARDEVLVKIKSTAVNHLDLVEASGSLKQILPIDLPWIPGHEFSGVVERIGSDVAQWSPGDAVFGTTSGMGAYAEYVAVKAAAVARKPTNLSFEEAASVPVASQTAWQGIFTHGHLEKGQTILIHGGAGAHTRTQYSFFGEDGLLRRHLYTVDVLGGSQGANYAFDYRAVDRLMIPTRRRVLAYDRDRQKVPEPVLVSIDLSEIHFA
jgi:D-arabinose 1-dehydrogenase-like Zn-dependent alcohol dehydrogenase